MKNAYLITIVGMVVIMGMMFYPTVRTVIGNVDSTGWLPIVTMAKTALPYAFLGLVIYGIYRIVKS
jgi:hypothetical protein